MKKIIFPVLILLIFSVANVFASPCCTVTVYSSITQTETTITVPFEYGLCPPSVIYNKATRTVSLAISYEYTDKEGYTFGTQIVNGTKEVDPEKSSDSYTFENVNLIKGFRYRVGAGVSDKCTCYDKGRDCVSDGFANYFIAEYGMPALDMEELNNGMLTPVGSDKAAVKISPSVNGFYNISAVSNNSSEVIMCEYGQNIYEQDTNCIYLENNKTYVYVVSTTDGNDLSAKVSFEPTNINELTPEVINPSVQENYEYYTVSNVYGLNSIKIAHRGIYHFEFSGENAEYRLLDTEGRTEGVFYDNQRDIVLNPGTYYIDTYNLDGNYSISISHIVPETIEYGKEYTLEPDESKYYALAAEQPTVITVESGELNIYLNGTSEFQSFYDGNNTAVIYGEGIYIEANNYKDESLSLKISSELMDSIPLDTEVQKPPVEADGEYFFAFKASEDGKYEFDFSKCIYSAYFHDRDNTNQTDFRTIDMKANEWVLVEMYGSAPVTVRKYIEPDVTPLTYDTEVNYEQYSGRAYTFSYTPNEDGIYKIYSEHCFYSRLKVYTPSKVLYEKEGFNSGFSLNFEMKKDEPVYIEIYSAGQGGQGAGQYSIKVTSPYTDITTDTPFMLSVGSEELGRYTASESGYYEFTFKQSNYNYNVYASPSVTIGDKTIYINKYGTSKMIVYAEKDEIIVPKFKGAEDEGFYCTVSASVSPVSINNIEQDVKTDAVTNAYYGFTPTQSGIHKISMTTEAFTTFSAPANTDCINVENTSYFYAEKDVFYVFTITNNTNITLTAVQSSAAELNTQYYAGGGQPWEYTINIPNDGYYNMDGNVINTEVFIHNNGKWYNSAENYYMYDLKQGTAEIILIPAADTQNLYNPQASFKLSTTTDTTEYSISVDGLTYYPERGILARINFTAPYNEHEFNVGLEITDTNGNKTSYDQMYIYKEFSTSITTESYVGVLQPNTKYKLKPYFIIGEDKIYGEEKEFTASRPTVERIKHTPYAVDIAPNDAIISIASGINGSSNAKYYYEFIQPVNAIGTTNVKIPEFMYMSVYDANFEYIQYDYINSYTRSYEFTSGEKYYLILGTEYYGYGNIEISSLPIIEDAMPFAIKNASVNGSSIVCTVEGKGVETPILYAGLYKNNALIEAVTIDNPIGEQTIDSFIKFANADNCKLMLIDKNTFEPLCKHINNIRLNQ